ncbi:UNVERIFIED_CONTAM: hypothetical protein Slati_3072800 [Sesamum latifolium]|uniref:Uncharacterized protein n=1 Tax=Sesamum latifolium TaxID=2727402 RepID=A0AAW2UTQ6_9LAMI
MKRGMGRFAVERGVECRWWSPATVSRRRETKGERKNGLRLPPAREDTSVAGEGKRWGGCRSEVGMPSGKEESSS